jgi:hypothetical protein
MKRIGKQLGSTSAARREETVVKNFHQYVGPGGQILHGYVRRYKNVRLRKKGFTSKAEAERHLRQAMNDIDAEERGEIRCKPTTAQEALNIYRRNLEVRARDKVINTPTMSDPIAKSSSSLWTTLVPTD